MSAKRNANLGSIVTDVAEREREIERERERERDRQTERERKRQRETETEREREREIDRENDATNVLSMRPTASAQLPTNVRPATFLVLEVRTATALEI